MVTHVGLCFMLQRALYLRAHSVYNVNKYKKYARNKRHVKTVTKNQIKN